MRERSKDLILPYTPDKVEFLRHRLNTLLEANIITISDLPKLVYQERDRKTLHAWLKNRMAWSSSITEEDFHLIVAELQARGELFPTRSRTAVREVNDHPYFSMTEFMGVRPTTEQEMKAMVPGYYVAYRPSVYIPDGVVVSIFKIWVDPHSGAVRTKEIQFYREGRSRPKKRQTYSGYLVRRRSRYLCFDMDSSTEFMRTTILVEAFFSGDQTLGLTGVSTGIIGAKTYSTRVHMERLIVNDWDGLKSFMGQLNVYRRSQIPDSILGAIDPQNQSNIHIF